MYSTYCSLRQLEVELVEVEIDCDIFSAMDIETRINNSIFGIYFKDDDGPCYTHPALKYCLDNNMLWFDEYVLANEDRFDAFMILYHAGMKVILVDSDDLSLDTTSLISDEIVSEKASKAEYLYNVPVPLSRVAKKFYIQPTRRCISQEIACQLIQQNPSTDNIKYVLDAYTNGVEDDNRSLTMEEIHQQYNIPYQDLYACLPFSELYRYILLLDVRVGFASSVIFQLCYGFDYYTPFVAFEGKIRDFYLSSPCIKECKGTGCQLTNSPYMMDTYWNRLHQRNTYGYIPKLSDRVGQRFPTA